MSTGKLIDLLSEYLSSWPQEASTVSAYMTFVQSHDDCFERTLLVGHVTGSAWLVNAAGTHVLLTHHRKLNKWFQLGGHADGHSDVLKVALREAREESGIESIDVVTPKLFDIDIHEIPARKNEPAHLHYDARFAFRVSGSETFAVSEESHALAWVKISEIDQHTIEASMLRMADKWKQHKAPLFM